MKTINPIKQKYYLQTPGGSSLRVAGIPTTREQALAMVSALAAPEPETAPGRYALATHFEDEQLGSVRLPQMAVSYYPEFGWGLSEASRYMPFSVTEEDLCLYGRHLRRAWGAECSDLLVTRERRCGIPALQINDSSDEVLRITVSGRPICLPYIDSTDGFGFILRLDAPDMNTALFMVEAIFGEWVDHKGIPLHTPPAAQPVRADSGSWT